MANANTNLLSIDIRQSASSTNSNAKTFGTTKHSYSTRHSGTSDFNSALNKANSQISRSGQFQRAKELPVANEDSAGVKVETKSTDVKSLQGQNNQAQDAPQSINQQTTAKTSETPVTNEAPTESVPLDANAAAPAKVPANDAPVENPAPENVAEVPAEVPAEIPLTTENQASVELPVNLAPVEIPQVEVQAPVENVPLANDKIPARNISFDNAAKVPADNFSVSVEVQVPVENSSLNAAVEPEEIPEVQEIPQAQVFVAPNPYFFVANTESLLSNKNVAPADTSNLMAIMPRADDDNAQSMLDLLSGKTWKSADVQESIVPQNLQPASLTADNHPVAQNVNVNPIQARFQSPPQQFSAPTIQAGSIEQSLQVQQQVQQPQQVLTPTIQAAQIVEQPMQVQQQQPQQFSTPTIQAGSIEQQPLQVQQQVQQPQQVLTPIIQAAQNVEQPILRPLEQPILQPIQQTQSAQPQVQQQLTPILQAEQAVQIPAQLQVQAQPQIPQPQFNFQIPFQPELNQQPLQAQPELQQQPQLQAQPQVQQRHFGQEIQPMVNSIQPQIEVKQVNQQQPLSDLLGVSVQVEDNSAAPINPVQPQPQQQQQFNQNQPQQFVQQNFQQTLTQQISQPNFAQVSNVEVQAQGQSFAGEGTFAQNLSPALNNNQPSVQTTAQSQAPETAQAPRENFNIPAQIVENARLIRNAQNTEMIINLKPEHLGQLTVRVSVGQTGALTASFYTNNVQVQAILENSLTQLRQELNDQGLKVENVQVYSGFQDGGLTNGQGQQTWQQNQQQAQSSNRRVDFGAFQEETDAVTPIETKSDGVDYKV